MAKKIFPVNDAEFAVWLANLINKCELHKAILNLTAEQIMNITTKHSEFKDEVALKQQKREESAAQTELVKNSRKKLNRIVSSWNRAFKAIDGLPSNIIEEVGLSADENNLGGSTPSAPTSLVVTGTSDGTNSLKWNRNGNRQGTLFIIEAKTGSAENWSITDAVTGTNYKHKNQIPGVKIQYKIKAKRGELESGTSNTAVVYD